MPCESIRQQRRFEVVRKEALDALKAYVKEGGRLIVNFDPVLNLPTSKTGDTPKLATLVNDWGFTAKTTTSPARSVKSTRSSAWTPPKASAPIE